MRSLTYTTTPAWEIRGTWGDGTVRELKMFGVEATEFRVVI